MISRLGTCGGPVCLVSSGGEAQCAGLQTCPSKDAATGHRGAGFGISSFSLPWEHSVACWWMAEDGITPPSHPQVGKPTPAAVQVALTDKWTICPPVSQASIRFLPSTLLLWAIDPPGATALLCFISGTWPGFKTPNLKGPGKAWTHSPPPEESLTVLCLVSFCPRKAVTQPPPVAWGIW